MMKNWRVNLIFALFFVFGATVTGRLFSVQILQGDFYRALAQGQQALFLPVIGERGGIFFNSGEALAISVKEKYAFVSPTKIKDKESTAKAISQVLNIDENYVLEKLTKDSGFEEIKAGISAAEAEALERTKLDGVYVQEGIFRKYPQGTIASKDVGFLGGEGLGQYGVEGYYDDILQGREALPRTGQGGSTAAAENSGKGSDIILTIDFNIQFMAEKLLKEAKEGMNIEGGQIIVMDPKSGAIIALADFPNFDPNSYWEAGDFQIFQNSAIQKFFEPGSVFKSITMAGALDQEKINPQTTYVDYGSLQIGEYTIYNFDRQTWGEKTMTQVLERSINTGAVFAERQLGHKLFLEYVQRFGFFEPTGIDLQGEDFSENKELKKGYEINFATSSFGQGIGMTPLQLVRGFSAIANGGKLVRPHIAAKIIQGDKITEISPSVSYEGVISQKTATQITSMLISVVENGSGKKARIPNYYVAGKTGTAQIPWSAIGINEKGYSEKTWQSFIGYAPALSPRFTILVKLDNPNEQGAEYSAAPIFQKLAKYIIDYWEIPPDYD